MTVKIGRILTGLLLLAVCAAAIGAQVANRKEIEIVKPKAYSPRAPAASHGLKTMLDRVVAETLKEYKEKNLSADQLAVTLVDLRDPANPVWADHRGESKIYPASVVKVFYMAALHQQLEDGKIKLTDELERGLRDMIVDSSNEATQYILDVLTDTSSGAELPQTEFELWQYRRNRVNRYFMSMGFQNINVNQKTFCEDAYGIEQQSRNYKGENRNMLTTNATARLLAEIAAGRSVNAERSSMMMGLLKRDPFADPKRANSQAVDFSGKALIDRKLEGARLWSKAGWTSRTRHDAAYIEMPDGQKFAVAVFTENNSSETGIIPAVVWKIIDGFSEIKGK